MPGSQGKNPLFTDVYTADPGALVDGCTFYIHCGHDEGPSSFVLREWYALSSTDMVHWEKKVAMKVSDFSWADANAWAGQVVKKDGKYYWFAPVQERGGGMAIGVAMSDSPTGPFKDAIGKPLVNDAFEMSNAGFRQPSDTPFTIDPTVWIDDDGQAYLHYGGFSRMMVAKLTADLTGIDGKLQEVTPRGFFEAAYLIKHNDLYYEIYAAGTNPATIDYSTSDSPFGPWMYRGRILDALPGQPGEDAPTNHAAVAQLAGQWYLVYHVSNGPNGGGTYKREVAVDKLTIKPDGTIDKVTPTAGLKF
jgi:beta-xylosidase